jgi:hypothetical protein
MKYVFRTAVMCVVGLTIATSAWAQWSSDPSQNLDLSNIAGADQVQPKLLPLPNNSWRLLKNSVPTRVFCLSARTGVLTLTQEE